MQPELIQAKAALYTLLTGGAALAAFVVAPASAPVPVLAVLAGFAFTCFAAVPLILSD